MRLLAALLLSLLTTVAARAAEPSWTGQWDTRWRDGGARMELKQDGDTLTGAYPAYGGQITGTVQGREMHGQWTEGRRSGNIVFVIAPDGSSFMGRFDTGEWWTGGRVAAGKTGVTLDQAGARQALRSFVVAGNAARSGKIDEWAKAAAVVEFGDAGAALAPGQKLAAARSLFELVDQTTFQLFAIPGRRAAGDRLDLQLKQAGTTVVLPLSLVRGADKLWRVLMPAEDLGKLREALLARSGGRLPPAGEIKRRATARDAMRSFIAGFEDWTGSGRAQVFDVLDLSGFSDATRDYEGELAAAYMNESLDRIGKVIPQEISDDPQDRVPYTVFSHPAGSLVLAPATEGGGWRFTADTVHGARDLYTAIEDMPEVDGGFATDVPSSYMKVRRWVRSASPALFSRVGPLELWQGLGIAVVLLCSFAVAYVASFIVVALLRLLIGGRPLASEREFRWPLRLTVAFLLYSAAVSALGLPEAVKRISTGATGVIIAAAIVWGGWKLLDTFGASAMRRAEARAGTLDEIVVSLVLGACKLVLLAGGFVFIAQALSIPYEGVIAGLGIGGLAFAFASKETLSNVFGAGILVADRPFRRGDWIEAGEAKGTVEHVGIRSTRIRTGNDSLMFVPNGKLADATVNNLGTRRHRVANAKLLLPCGTGAETLASFMDGVESVIRSVPHVKPGSVQVGVASITPDGIELEFGCCLDVRSSADERADKTALLLGVLRLAERLHLRLGDDEPLLPATAAPVSAAA
jgi:small-conductance mechanosensitive channel